MDKSRPERVWMAAGLAAGTAMLLIGWFLFISPQMGETASVDSQVGDAQIHNMMLQHSIAELGRQNKNLAQYRATLAQDQLALPSASGLPDFLRTLQTIGNSTLTNVVSLTVGTPANVTVVSTQKIDASAPGTSVTPTMVSVSGPQLYALPITAQISGSVTQLDQFLSQLQSVQPRAVLISQIVESAGGADGGTTGLAATQITLTMQAFVQPSGALDATAPSGVGH